MHVHEGSSNKTAWFLQKKKFILVNFGVIISSLYPLRGHCKWPYTEVTI